MHMSFNKTMADIMKWMPARPTFFDAEVLWAFWETQPEIVQKLLPSVLEPLDRPLACCFVARYPRVNFLPPYTESALFLMCKYRGEPGMFCLSMPVSDDMAMVLGREASGYPKKIGKITIQREGDIVTGSTARRGVTFMEVEGRMTGNGNVDDFPEFVEQNFKSKTPVYLIKNFPTPDGGPTEPHSHIVKQIIKTKRKTMDIGEMTLRLVPSELDPWTEVEVVTPLGAVYTIYDLEMMPAHVFEEIPPKADFPFLMYDFFDTSKF
jgi:acetoacetate decarboxylase